MYEKYHPLIISKINSLKISYSDWDDYVQEGLLILDKALKTFDDKYNKSFTRYFELLLIRRFLYLRNKSYRNKVSYLNEEIFEYVASQEESVESAFKYVELFNIPNLSSFENKIVEFVFKKGYSYKETATILNCEMKKIYNTIQRIKSKAKDYLDKVKY